MTTKKGRASYPNDDHSRFAGPGYRGPEENFGLGEVDPSRERELERIRSQGSQHMGQPGVSGKDRDEGNWFNQSQYQTQKQFIGKGPKGYRRSDARIHEEVCEALKYSPTVDATDIEIEVKEGVVILRGHVYDRKTKRLAEACLDHIWGIEEVQNSLRLHKAGNLQDFN